jgi:hypothetical protein
MHVRDEVEARPMHVQPIVVRHVYTAVAMGDDNSSGN